MLGSALNARKTAKRQTAQVQRYPAPNKGTDQRVAVSQGSPAHCIFTYNLTPFEHGMRVRSGYREFQVDIEDTNANGARTIIPYDGTLAAGTNDRLFVVTNEGIWDTSVSGAAPALKVSFADDGDEAGYGVYTHYVTDAGADFLFYADSLNGLFTYDPVTDTWAQTTGITGPTIADIRFIVVHKQRIWLIEEDDTKAWYLPVGSIGGTAVEFYFGSKFRHGGNLEGLFNWTIDGGDGVDDMLVAVSRAGDVLPYKGADPSSATTWELVGNYFIGEIPKGPFFGTEHGGELFLLSINGVVSMNDLLQGVNSNVLLANAEDNSIAGKISGDIRALMKTLLLQPGWAIRAIPGEGGLLISIPEVASSPPIQYYYNFSQHGWGLWRDVPMTCFDTWNGTVFFGTDDNRVCSMDVSVDNALLTPPAGAVNNGDPIVFSVLTGFMPLGGEGVYKRVSLIRPDFLALIPPVTNSQARYDYDTGEAVVLPSSGGVTNLATFDVAIWDAAAWANANPKASNIIRGAAGSGRYVAIATKGSCSAETRLIGWDVIYTAGGPLI